LTICLEKYLPDRSMVIKEQYTNISKHHPVILFDGFCHLCDKSVNWVLQHDNKQFFRFCPLQYAVKNPNSEINYDSVILLWNEKVYDKSEAVLLILKLMGGRFYILYSIGKCIPKYLRDVAYSFVAKHRYRWFGKYDTCKIPTPQT